METRRRPSTLPLPAALLIAAICATARAEPVLAPVQARLVRPMSKFLAHSLQAAFERAEQRLTDERCALVLADFFDREGRSLTDHLAATGQSGAEYLSQLFFFDGTPTRPCQNGVSLAWTSPGSRGVFLCGQRFAQAARRDPELGSVILIHEEFHSLGLGENPPSSAEITARIAERCRQRR